MQAPSKRTFVRLFQFLERETLFNLRQVGWSTQIIFAFSSVLIEQKHSIPHRVRCVCDMVRESRALIIGKEMNNFKLDFFFRRSFRSLPHRRLLWHHDHHSPFLHRFNSRSIAWLSSWLVWIVMSFGIHTAAPKVYILCKCAFCSLQQILSIWRRRLRTRAERCCSWSNSNIASSTKRCCFSCHQIAFDDYIYVRIIQERRVLSHVHTNRTRSSFTSVIIMMCANRFTCC